MGAAVACSHPTEALLYHTFHLFPANKPLYPKWLAMSLSRNLSQEIGKHCISMYNYIICLQEGVEVWSNGSHCLLWHGGNTPILSSITLLILSPPPPRLITHCCPPSRRWLPLYATHKVALNLVQTSCVSHLWFVGGGRTDLAQEQRTHWMKYVPQVTAGLLKCIRNNKGWRIWGGDGHSFVSFVVRGELCPELY